MTSPPAQVFCIHCGYDLQGRNQDSTACPECGRDIRYVDDPAPRVPWEQRGVVGRLPAFCRTVWLVTFKQCRFAESYFHELNYSAANRFRWLVSGLAVLPIVGLLVTPSGLHQNDDFLHTTYGWTICVLVPAVLWLFWSAAIQVSGLYFDDADHPDTQRQGLALSLYACAPLAWGPLLSALLLGVRFVGQDHLNEGLDIALKGLRIACPLITGTLWWLLLMNTANRVRRKEGWSLARMELGFIAQLVLLGGAVLIVLPVAAAWIALLLESIPVIL